MRRSAALLVLALCLAGAAGAYRYDVRDWSAAWEGFSDDFEDGVLPAGGPGEALIYMPICAVTSDSETGGALVLAGPDPQCAAGPGAVLATTGGITVGETRATFRFAVPALGQSYGVTLSDLGSTDTASLVLARNAVAPLFADALLVVLLADPNVASVPTPVAFTILSITPPHDTVSAAAIELRLATAPGAGGVAPSGSFRLCASSPCEDEATTPFQALTPATPPHPDGGVLDPALAHGPALVAFSLGAGDFSFAVEEWSTRGSASDDFESAAFAETVPYVFSCGSAADVEQGGGILSLVGPVAPCGGNGLVFNAALPGPFAIHASFEFAVPGPCEAYGVSAGPGFGDFAFLSLVRSQDPLGPGGGEALTVRLASESEFFGPVIPVVASARISDDPQGDPALADVRSIDFELDLAADPAGLVPTGRFRLCTDTGCPPAFTPLEPNAPASDPDAIVCGRPASSYDPPPDGGAIVHGGPVGAALIATRVPEPVGGVGVALLTVGALRRWRTTRGRKDDVRGRREGRARAPACRERGAEGARPARRLDEGE